MIEKNEQLLDIYDLWYQPFYKQSWFYYFVIVVVVFLCIVFCVYIYKKYMQKKHKVDCSVIAYRELDDLKKIQIINSQDSKDSYFKVSLIIKTYLSCRYHQNFMKLTDKETIEYAKDYMHDEALYLLQKILQSMTFIKFEREFAMTEKLQKDIQLVREFISNTTPADITKEI